MREKPMEKRENGVRVENLTGALPMSEMLEKYVDVEKFLGYCAACPRCGQTWSCPPYDFDPAAVWPQYAAVTLYAVQVFPESEEAKTAALADPEMFLRPYRRAFDALLEERERETRGSLRLDAEKLRYSLESLGANVGALAADKLGAPLQWGTKDAPPEYFVLVGAVLTKGE